MEDIKGREGGRQSQNEQTGHERQMFDHLKLDHITVAPNGRCLSHTHSQSTHTLASVSLNKYGYKDTRKVI